MAALGPWPIRRSGVIKLVTTLGVAAVLAGGTLLGANVVGVSGAATTPTLRLSSTAAGVTCNNSNPTSPVCSGLAGGEVVSLSGAGFTKGSLASIEQCNSDPTQPVMLFLGNDVPVSCSQISITTISSKGVLTGTHTMKTGTVGPPTTGTPTCTQTVPTTSVITGCSTSGNPATDAAKFPCPPTPAQQAAGDTCVLAIGDQAGDRAIGIALFGTETVPTSSTSTTGGGTSTTGGSTSTTGATTTTTGTTTTTTSPTSTSTATQVSASAVTLGTSGAVSDTVTVQGTATHGSPTGNVNFYVCQTGTSGTLIRGPCAATTSSHLSTAHLTAGTGNTATAPSGSFTPTSAGTWCFSAVYGGDTIYTGSSDNTSSANLDAHECVLVSPSPSTTSTFISSAKLTLGPLNSATDTVTVLGNVVGGAPTGGVTFYACHTSITAIFTPAPCPTTGAPQDAGVILLTGAGATSAASSRVFVPTSVGTWCFSAVYGGSSTYSGSSDNTSSSNLDADECLIVVPPNADAITSNPNASARAAFFSSFLITTSGSQAGAVKKKGKLPKGVHFTNNHNGTATISGIPNLKKGIGVYHLTIKAIFGKGKTKHIVTQAFTYTVT
ncbi:MAG TPA: hypothetical protein VMU64_02070 [Acidimicrobiales bacterium]|nr:hypothetical protein [Acidimicrobiales bacterium]